MKPKRAGSVVERLVKEDPEIPATRDGSDIPAETWWSDFGNSDMNTP